MLHRGDRPRDKLKPGRNSSLAALADQMCCEPGQVNLAPSDVTFTAERAMFINHQYPFAVWRSCCTARWATTLERPMRLTPVKETRIANRRQLQRPLVRFPELVQLSFVCFRINVVPLRPPLNRPLVRWFSASCELALPMDSPPYIKAKTVKLRTTN